MRLGPTLLVGAAILALLFVALVPQWRTPGAGTQLGWRASSMIQFSPTAAEAAAANPPPPPLPKIADDPRSARDAFKNVKVLTDLNAGDFMRVQAAMTAWVAPKQGCGFCHVANDYASDARPQKTAARIMLAMTRHVNTAWRSHVGAGGVTCFSCHRGEPVPSEVWYQSPPPPDHAMIDRQEDYDEAARTVRTFFPNEGYEEYLLQDTPGVAQSYTPLPTGEASAQIVIKRLYEAMMQMSDGIGVNCGYCHNSRAFFDWRQSTPARWIGYSGITMTRDLNRNFLLKIAQALPLERIRPNDTRTLSVAPSRWSPQVGDGLLDCATCHHGQPKPESAALLLKAFPALAGPDAAASGAAGAPVAPAPAPSSTARAGPAPSPPSSPAAGQP